jgi:hypothetical protein
MFLDKLCTRFSRLVLLALLPLFPVAAHATSPGQDPFYLNAAPDPGASAGDVLASRSSTFALKPFLADMWQVIYQTENANAETIAVSGTVIVPKTRWPWWRGKRPIVGYSVGTRGLGDACAPSYTLSTGLDYEGLFIRALLDKGYAVAISDYEGLGTPGTHTYMVGPSQGRAALDMIRAAQRLPQAGLSSNAPVGLLGYSQGGGAAGWAAELAASYAPELNIRGAALGGVPGDLGATAEFLDGRLALAFALFAAVGLDTAYDELALETYLNARGQDLLEDADQLCLVSIDGIATLLDAAFTSIDDYVTSNPLETPAWQFRLGEQELGHNPPTMPIYQYHAVVDEIVPYAQARDLRRTWCDQGVNVTWVNLPAEHALGLVQGFPGALHWLGDRLAGWSAWGNCWLP